MQVKIKYSSLPETEYFLKPFSQNCSIKEMVLSKGKLGQCFSRSYKYTLEFNSWAFLNIGEAHLALFTFASTHPYLCRDVEYFSKSTMVHCIFFSCACGRKAHLQQNILLKLIGAVPIQHPIPKLQCLFFSRNSLGKKNQHFCSQNFSWKFFWDSLFHQKAVSFPTEVWNRFKVTIFSSVLL